MERYKKALADKRAGLTFPALTGEQNQSVKNAESLFNLQEWFKLNGYHEEKSMSQLLGTGIVQLMRGGYLSFKEAVSTMKCWTTFWMTGCHGISIAMTSVCWR